MYNVPSKFQVPNCEEKEEAEGEEGRPGRAAAKEEQTQ